MERPTGHRECRATAPGFRHSGAAAGRRGIPLHARVNRRKRAAGLATTGPQAVSRCRRHGWTAGTAILLCLGCRPDAPAPVRIADVLLITIDTARADKFSYTGSSSVATPAIDTLAADGTAFSQAVSPAPITLVAHASLLTGQTPLEHGVHNNGTYRLGAEAVTLAELLRDEGFRTAAFVGAAVLDSRQGLDQGFDHYDDDVYDDKYHPERRGAAVVARALDWLRRVGPGGTFVWVHLFDPHSPYDPPEPERSRYPQALYDGEIAYVDRVVGDLLDGYRALERYDSALVVLTSDHGESLGEHGEESHGVFIYDATVRVPLIIRAPGIAAGKRADPQVQLVDILPTVAELVGIEPPSNVRGRSLAPLMRGESLASAPAYLESRLPEENYGWARLSGVRSEGWKLIVGVEPELYDLAADAVEVRDLAAERPGKVADLEQMMRSEFAPEERDTGQAVAIDETLRRQLEALGYVGAGRAGGERRAQGPAPDPRRLVHLGRARSSAAILFDRGLHGAGIERLRQVLRQDPANPWVRDQLSRMLLAAGRLDEADPLAEEMLTGEPPDPRGWRYRGLLLELDGRDREAAAAFGSALEADPTATDLRWRRWDLLLALGDGELVAREAAAALTADPDDFEALVAAGRATGDPARLVEELRSALASAADEPALLAGLGSALFRQREFAEALPLLERAQAAAAADERYAIALTRTLAALGRSDGVSHVLRNLRTRAMFDPEAWLLLAHARLDLGDRPGALAAWRRVTALTGGRPRSWLAAFRRRSPVAAEALSPLEPLERSTAAAGARGVSLSATLRQAEALLGAGRAVEGRSLLESLYRREAFDPVVALLYAHACAATGDETALREVLALLAELVDAAGAAAFGEAEADRLWAAQSLSLLGTGRWQATDYSNALTAYLLGERLVPRDPRFPYNQGLTWERLGDFGAALAAFERTLHLEPSFPRAEEHRRALAQRLGPGAPSLE